MSYVNRNILHSYLVVNLPFIFESVSTKLSNGCLTHGVVKDKEIQLFQNFSLFISRQQVF